MKKCGLIFFVICVSLILFGCESTGQKTKSGALIGAGTGAVVGGIIGHQSGHGLQGAGLGAVLGGLGGALIGNSQDKAVPQAEVDNSKQITVLNIVDMKAKEVPDDVIISEIQRTKSVYNLSAETVAYLKKNKVSDKVIDYMNSNIR